MKKINYLFITLILLASSLVGVNAETVLYNDIPNNSYVIGKHLFTSRIGLTTRHIMLGAKTIDGTTINDMQILYKNPRGKLTDGLTGNNVDTSASYVINYRDSSSTVSGVMEDEYSTVTYRESDIPVNSYVIGTHLFTSETSLTTKHIMIAAKTIGGNSINDMQIYYKNPRGKWINGLSREEITPQSTYQIKYVDLVGSGKRNGYVTLSETSKEVPYGTDAVTFSVTGSHGGAITANDDNSISEVTTNGNEVTIGNINHLSAGSIVNVTVKVGSTNTYSEAEASYTLKITKAMISKPNVVIDNSYESNGYVKWEDVDGAVSYQLSFDNVNYHEAQSGTEQVSLVTTGEVSAYVKAIPDSNHITTDDNYGSAVTNVYYLRLTGDTNIASVSGAGNYISETVVPIIATPVPNQGYKLAHWDSDIGGSVVDDENLNQIKLEANTTLYAKSGPTELFIHYNGNGGVWNNPISGSNVYDVNEDGTVVFKDGSIYSTTLEYNKSLARDGLTDYNSNWIDFVKDGYVAYENREYFINNGNTKTVVGQNTIYSAIELASYGGCDLSAHDCTVTAMVNWQPSHNLNIKYSVNGGSINNSLYGVNESGFITKDGSEVVTSANTVGSLPRGGLIDYNEAGFNITKTDAEVPSGKEYYLMYNSQKIELNQRTTYKASDIASMVGCNLENADCNVTAYVNWLENHNLYIQYNGNGGVWNSQSVNGLYSANSDGYVTKDGNIYTMVVKNGEVLPSGGLLNYNGNDINFVKENHIASLGSEYYVTNNDSVVQLDQDRLYQAKELASYAGCDLDTSSCTITVNVNWKEIHTLNVQYNGNGGTWNSAQASSEYNVDDDGYVTFDGDRFVVSLLNGESLDSGLIEYNGNTINFTRDDASVVVGEEYVIEGPDEDIILDQSLAYSAKELASYAGCNLDDINCTVTLKVNWVLITNSDFIKVDGTNFVKKGLYNDGDNSNVLLNGFNLGEWMSRAISLSPIGDVSESGCTSNSSNASELEPYTREYTDNNVQINYALTRRVVKDMEIEDEKNYIPDNGNLENYLDWNENNSDLDLEEVFNRVFDLNEIYYDSFITDSDIKTLKDMGVTSVRVPIEWSYFAKITKFSGPIEKPTVSCNCKVTCPSDDASCTKCTANNFSVYDSYDYDYELLPDDKLEARMSRLDWLVETCRRNGIYVVFDLHVVPGSANVGGITSLRGGSKFLVKRTGDTYQFMNGDTALKSDYDKSVKAQDFTNTIWSIISERFNGNPGVAGYELLNEPGLFNSNNELLINYYDTLYNTIRNNDSDHVIIMEAPMCGGRSHYLDYNKLGSERNYSNTETYCSKSYTMPLPSSRGWENVAYSVHDYFQNNGVIVDYDGDGVSDDIDNSGSFDAQDIIKAIKSKVLQLVEERNIYQVPIYVGETNWWWNERAITWPILLEYYAENNISIEFWTYKAAKDEAFGLIYNLKDDENYANHRSFANLITDDYDTIAEKFYGIAHKDSDVKTGNGNMRYYDYIKRSFRRNGNVLIQYNGNNGVWHDSWIPEQDIYSVDEDGFVTIKSTGEIYKQNVGNHLLTDDGFVDYNGSWFNWTRDSFEVTEGAEYYIVNGSFKFYLDQAKQYSVKELAEAQGCPEDSDSCVVTLYVNWKPSNV